MSARKGFILWREHERFEAGVIVVGHFKIPVGWVLGVVGIITFGLFILGGVGTFVLPPVEEPGGHVRPSNAWLEPFGWWTLGLLGVGILFGMYAFFAWTYRVFAVAQRGS